jgi:anti-sigma factor RsiW
VTMRDCPDGALRDLLPLYVSGQLGDADHARVEAHVQGCADCTAEIELLRATVRAFEVKPIDAATISAKLPTARSARRARPFHSQPLWRVAAVITFMIAGTATMMVVRQPSAGSLMLDTLATLPADGRPTPAETTIAANTLSGQHATSTISFGNNLSDLTDAQLEALLASLDRMDGTVSADPVALVTPIVPEASGRRNQ